MVPIGKYIVVEDINEEIKTDSGLFLSGEDAAQLRYRKAKVLESGTEVLHIHADDVIYYDKNHSFTMLINEKPCTIIREGDVVVVL